MLNHFERILGTFWKGVGIILGTIFSDFEQIARSARASVASEARGALLVHSVANLFPVLYNVYTV